jgi:hypothetical protein
VLRGGKKQVMGKVAYAGSIRAKDPLQCCHGALGRLFVFYYTLQRKPFPSPADQQLWRHRSPVWLGGDDQSSISYTQQATNQKVYMREAGVSVKKVTHVWRSHKARDMDDQGCDDDVSAAVDPRSLHVLNISKSSEFLWCDSATCLCGWLLQQTWLPQQTALVLTAVVACCCCCHVQMIARLGRWLRTALNTSYLKFFKPKGLLAAGQWDKDRPDGFFAERFCLDVQEELVLLVFPWLPELSKQVRCVV